MVMAGNSGNRDVVLTCDVVAGCGGVGRGAIVGLDELIGAIVGVTGGPESREAGVRLDSMAMGREVMSAADQMTMMITFACVLGIRNRIGYMIATYLSILMATIV